MPYWGCGHHFAAVARKIEQLELLLEAEAGFPGRAQQHSALDHFNRHRLTLGQMCGFGDSGGEPHTKAVAPGLYRLLGNDLSRHFAPR